jgi:putative ABC transport system permease protein
MLRHLLTIAIRNILKHFNYSILNILGLAIGISSFLFILIYVNDELKYDRFHANHKQIYRMNRLYDSNDIHEDAATVSFPFGPALAADYPDMIKSMVRFFDFQVSEMLFEYELDSVNILKFNEEWFYLADSNVFQMFSFPLLEGDPNTVLDRPHTVVLSESTARKYFGEKPAIGQTLRIEEQLEVEVTGVMKDLPSQSHFNIDILGSMSTFRELQRGQMPQTWIWNPCWTYVELYENVSVQQLEAQLADFHQRQYADFKDQKITLYTQALADIHLKSHHEYEMHPNGKSSYIKILAIIGLFVLILACINFMNLATASSSGRGREIGMKKVIGAGKSQLRAQFLGESLIITFFALVLSAILIEMLLPVFNNFTGKAIDTGIIVHPQSLGVGFLLLLLVGLLSGSYPAFFLSGLGTSHLKGSLSNVIRKQKEKIIVNKN